MTVDAQAARERARKMHDAVTEWRKINARRDWSDRTRLSVSGDQAFDLARDVLALADLLEHRNSALLAICQTNDSGPWIDVYRARGGGYEGLQAIAERAMQTEPSA